MNHLQRAEQIKESAEKTLANEDKSLVKKAIDGRSIPLDDFDRLAPSVTEIRVALALGSAADTDTEQEIRERVAETMKKRREKLTK